MDTTDSIVPTDAKQQISNVEQFHYHEEAKIALVLASEVGEILRQNAGLLHDRTAKGRTNFKIELDDRIDELARERLGEAFPDYAIRSEEADPKETDSEREWIIDPIDGTLPYTFGYSDHTALSVCLAEKGDPKLGVLEVALQHATYVAEVGHGAFRNNEAIRVSNTSELNDAIIGIDYGKDNREQMLPLMQRLLSPDGITYPVTFGGTAASLVLVADGRLDGYCSLNIEPWDAAAGAVICAEAGATVTNAQGEPWSLGDTSILVANATLHPQLLQLAHAT